MADILKPDRFSYTGALFGQVFGSFSGLFFTVATRAGRWLFIDLPFSSAIACFGMLLLAWIVGCGALGGFAPLLIAKARRRQST